MVHITPLALAVVFSAVSAAAATTDKRIIGGQDVKTSAAKFLVSLRDENGTHVCAGNLLDSTTVLTAAHCLVDDIPAVSVRAGIVDPKTAGVDAKVACFKKHDNYTTDFPDGLRWFENDIAIIKLSSPIDKSKTIDYAVLPLAGGDAVVNSTATAEGWGVQAAINTYSDRDKEQDPVENLSRVELPIHTREYCATFKGVGDRDTFICAGEPGKNVCVGDSGGPLFDEEKRELLGVVSWSTMLGDDLCKGPAVFSRVGSYIDFINKYLGPHSGPGSACDP